MSYCEGVIDFDVAGRQSGHVESWQISHIIHVAITVGGICSDGGCLGLTREILCNNTRVRAFSSVYTFPRRVSGVCQPEVWTEYARRVPVGHVHFTPNIHLQLLQMHHFKHSVQCEHVSTQ